MENKIRVLTVSDFGVKTGFARVMESIVNNFPDNYEVHSIAINYRGDYYETKARLYPASNGGDLYGLGRLKPLAKKLNPDIIFILQDSWIAQKYLEIIPEYLDRVVIYTPVDAGPYQEEWVKDFHKVKQVVCYTEFGKNVILNANPKIKNISVIPHGIDKSTFYPLDKKEARKNVKNITDEFIVLNVNRNQIRKKLDVALKGFSIFAKDKPDVRYYHHAGVEDAGWNVIKLAKRYGFENKLMLTSMNLSPRNGVSDKALNIIYNIADVGLNTSLGEGWGLCFSPDTNITTPSGYKAISDIKVGDDVFDADGNINKVLKTYKRFIDEEIREIKISGCYRTLLVTNNHPFLTKSGWKNASELTTKDFIYKPYIDDKDVTIDRIDLSEYTNLFFDDNYIYTKSKRFAGKVANKKELIELQRLVNSNISKNYYRRFNRYLKTDSKEFYTLMGYLLLGANKYDHIYRKDLEFKNLIKDIFGYSANGLQKEFKAMLLRLADDLFVYLLLSKKILFNIMSVVVSKKGYLNQNNHQYTIAFRSETRISIIEHILSKLNIYYGQFQIKNDGTVYFVLNKNLFDNVPHFRDSYQKIDDLDGVYCRVVFNNPINYTGEVFNIEVENSHTYLAENYAVHNCNFEHACTMKPQIVPYNSANIELYDNNRGFLMPIEHTEVMPKILTEGKAVSPQTVAEYLNYVYYNREDSKTAAINAYNYFTSDKFSWDNIAKMFIKIFMENKNGKLANKH